MSEERETESGVVSFLVGVGLGAIVAGIAAVLYAPKPGAQVREQLLEATKELRGRAERVAEQARGALRQASDQLKQDFDAAIAAGQDAVAARRAELEDKTRGG